MNRRQRRAEGTVTTWLRQAGTAALWSLVTVLGLSAAGMLLSGGSYSGASDERVESFAAETYAAFLRGVLVALAKLAVAEWIAVTFVTLGLVHFYGWWRGRRGVSIPRLHVAAAAAATLTTLTFVGFGAALHPGLFLGALATSRVAALWSAASYYLAPGLVILSVVGHFAGAARARRPMQVAFVLAAALVGAGLGRARGFDRRHNPKMFAIASDEHAKKVVSASRTGARVNASGISGASGTSGVDVKIETPKKTGMLPRRPSSILWIAVDSLRPDHIDPVNTPHLAQLVAESIYFPNTITPVPRTGPSWAAAMTSLEPLTTGIETMFPDSRLSDLSTAALPAHLGYHGYSTMVVSEYAGEFFRRIKVGFDVEAVPRAELMQISGQIMMGRAPIVLAEAGLLYGGTPAARSLLPGPLVELIRGMPNFSVPGTLGQDVRLFLDTHREATFILAFYSQPHFPYTSSPKWAKKYRVPGSDPALAYGRDVASDRPITNDADRKQLDGLYRGALAETDAAVGELLAGLQKSGWLDDTIVVLSADHGEGLYECDECVGHGDNLRGMMTLRVPLAFRLPQKRFPNSTPTTVTQYYASLLDVYPTILELLGITRIEAHEGMSLLDEDGRPRTTAALPRTHVVETGEWLWTTSAVPKDRLDYPPITTLARLDGDRIAIDPKYEPVIRAAKHRAVIRAPYKLVYEPSRSGVRYRLFDIDADPLDSHDLAAEKPEVFADLKEQLRRSVLRHGNMLQVGDYFLTRPPGVPDHHW